MRINRPEIALVLSLLCAASMWFYVQRVLVPYQIGDAALHARPRGNLSDLYPRWLGARELLLHHRDPYSPEITREIQAGYYGRPLDPTRPADPKDQQAFAYPLYVVFLLAPTVFLPFSTVHVLFQWILVLLTALSVWLWLKTIGWRPSPSALAALLALSLGSFAAVQGFKLQQLSLLVCALMALCAAFLVRGRLWMAGFFLALATIKPQLTLLFVSWLLLWALSDLRQRRGFIYGFTFTLASLLIAAQLALPGWIWRFRHGLAAYSQYTGGLGSTLDALITPLLGRLLGAVLVAGVAVASWRARRESVDSPAFVLNTSLVLALTVVVIPMIAPYNQLLLLPGIFLLVRNWRILAASPALRVIALICAGIVCWPWLASAGLALASAGMPAQSLQRAWPVPLYTSLAIPPAVLVLLAACKGKTTSGIFP